MERAVMVRRVEDLNLEFNAVISTLTMPASVRRMLLERWAEVQLLNLRIGEMDGKSRS